MGLFTLSFTDYPFWIYHWMGTHDTEITEKPDYIIVLGGGGMPSPSGLMRSYHAAELATDYPTARIFIALPQQNNKNTAPTSAAYKMKQELMIRGIDSSRISLASDGYNTHTQALSISKRINKPLDSCFSVIVTSPEHMYRAIKTYKKAGFTETGGYSSFSRALNPSLLKHSQKTKQTDDSSLMLDLRYNIWTHLKYEIKLIREWVAIAYYKARGWI